MSIRTDVAIVGAGPNGLSIAAHLQHFGVDHVIVGHPMATWIDHMPKGMELKSEGFASTLYDPKRSLTLKSYCEQKGWNYADLGLPVRLDHFCDYGLAFQRAFAPFLIKASVTSVIRIADGYVLALDSGEELRARKVVLAVGITHYKRMPEELAPLASDRVTHSADHPDPSRLADRDVVVLGGGSSAMDLAVLLKEAGARVTLAARRNELVVHNQMRLPRKLHERVLAPMSGHGPANWSGWIVTELPWAFHRLRAEKRKAIVTTAWGPAAGWFMRSRLGQVPTLLGHDLQSAALTGDGVRLQFRNRHGAKSETVLEAQHVIAATGYHADVSRLKFLSPEIQRNLRIFERLPELSRTLESSLPGLYFVGPAAMMSFGPSMRFAYGARFAAPTVSRHLAATLAGGRKRTIPSIGDQIADAA